MGLGQVTRRVTDVVRGAIPFTKTRLTQSETDLGVHLRGNSVLLESLVSIVQDRIKGREKLPIPSDPVDCKATMAMDSELRWLISKFEYIHKSPVMQEEGEQPG